MDINLRSFYGLLDEDHVILEDVVADSSIHSDAIKVSACRLMRIDVRGAVYGGKEDCVDVNNKSEDVFIRADLFVPKGKYVATIKGGSKNIHLKGMVRGHSSEVDIDIGNLSDQSDNLTGPVYLDLVHEDGPDEPIMVRCLGGPRPVLLNEGLQKYEIVFKVPGFWQSWFLKGWKLLKKLGPS